MVLGQGLLLTLVASSVGLVAAVALTRFMASMLFHVQPRDPLTFALVAGVLAAVAIAATLIPAKRAMDTEPMVALRE
jgi:ABC-type antimicrobial peptide transport system permease subunit